MKYGDWLHEEAIKCGIELSEHQLRQFRDYYQFLIKQNKAINLTTITRPVEFYIKHFFDSLSIAKIIDMNKESSLIDIGTGAGFPGIPLKIAYPHLHLVLLDSLKKRVSFLNEVSILLGLNNIECLHGRAETVAYEKKYRERFDLATARAVAKLNTLVEYCLPFLKIGGKFIAMKGPIVSEEIIDATKAFEVLGKAELHQIKQFELPNGYGNRHLLVIKKRGHTLEGYPRRSGLPKKEPLR